ncbi:MAG: polysaccharide biosynthesis tyrosine autokinase [Caulobacter sp.]|nr:polysaccharide biosynthesis tyrosine autokinase [Caulobacter sp.]
MVGNEHSGGEYNRSVALSHSDGAALQARRFGVPGEYFGDADPAASEGPDIFRYLHILVKHWLVILAAVIVSTAVGLTLTLMTQPIYTAAVTLQIDKEAPRVLDGDSLNSPRDTTSYDEFFQTQYGLLNSRSLALRTVDRLNLINDAAFLKAYDIGPEARRNPEGLRQSLAGILQGSLDVTPIQRSRLVRVAFSSPDPNVSARIANGIAENFIASTLERRFDATSYARKFLEERIALIRAKLEASERQLVDYAKAEQIVSIGGGGGGIETGGGAEGGVRGSSNSGNQSLLNSSLTGLNSALTDARAARIIAEERWRQAQRGSGADLPEVLQSATIQGLTATRSALEADYQQKLQTFRPEFPEMVQLRTRIAELDRQIQAEVATIQGSVKRQYETALGQERSFEAQVNRLTGASLDLRGRTIQYDIIQREVDTNRTLYDGLLQRYKEIGVAGGLSTNNVSVVDPARAPGGPSKPQPIKNLIAAAFIGLLLGLGASFLLEALDETIRAPQDVETQLGLPLLGTIPKLEKGVSPAEAAMNIRSSFSEAYYSTRTALQFSTDSGVPKSILVVSARPSEGKTTSAVNLAQSLARLGARVLLVDADLRNPSVHRVLKAQNATGLSNYLSGGMSIEQLAQAVDIPNLLVLTSGPLPPSPAELLSSARLTELLQEAMRTFDHVVIDGPPVMGLADAPLIGSRAAGTVLVVEAGQTGRRLVKAAIRRMRLANSRMLGVLLTKFDARNSAYGYGYGYGYGYQYSYDYGAKPTLPSKS